MTDKELKNRMKKYNHDSQDKINQVAIMSLVFCLLVLLIFMIVYLVKK